MKEATTIHYGGIQSTVGDLLVNRLLPNRYTDAVGPFVFLDHLYPTRQKPQKPHAPTGKFAHPHRGIATFTYLFSGSLEHYDSSGHHGIVEAGGAQWMKAGNGVIHDENPSPKFQAEGGVLHALQFWVNLPAKNKAETPDYLAVQAEDVPEIELADGAGVLRVIIGTYEGRTSPIKTFSRQFIYHLRLQPQASFTLPVEANTEYAAFVPGEKVLLNGSLHGQSELLVFGTDETALTITNESTEIADVIFFGGEPYTEPIVAQGPFVMNSHLEIAEAYRDFFKGKYGQIQYEPVAS